MGKPSTLFLNAARFAALFFVALIGCAQPTLAAEPDLPLASQSPLSGVGFDDKPLYLPVQKNFQMAMLTAGSELGRTCGKMEAYGWRLSSTEQSRVDQIFKTTVDRFRGLGYEVAMQSPNSVSRDVSMFTADNDSKHFLTMWSAGDIGLVMVLCETGVSHGKSAASQHVLSAPSVQTFTQSALQSTPNLPASTKDSYEKFSPVGYWVGSYVCGQGYTGGTLTINQLKGENFEGTFHFYPTAKNPSVAEGRYTVYGQYDRASQRILINPGRWMQRPANYYNTIIVGSFDPLNQTLSAYFQGINGCTSFEAKQFHDAKSEKQPLLHKHAKPKAKKAKVAALKAAEPAKAVDAPKAEAPKAETPAKASVSAPTETASKPTVEAPAPVETKPAETKPAAAVEQPVVPAAPAVEAAAAPAVVAPKSEPPLAVGAPTTSAGATAIVPKVVEPAAAPASAPVAAEPAK